MTVQAKAGWASGAGHFAMPKDGLLRAQAYADEFGRFIPFSRLLFVVFLVVLVHLALLSNLSHA
jgi:hypothetical protein